MHFSRGFIAWLVIAASESTHGTLRRLFLEPAVGDLNARRIAFFTGVLLIFAIAYLMIGWISARSAKALFAVGAMWAVLTIAFEFGLGLLVLGYSRERVFEDYDVTRGGLMGFGIAYMLFAPYLAARLRGLRSVS